MSKAVAGVAVAALVISLVALGVVAYTYVMATNAINNSHNNNNANNNNGNNNQQTTVTVYSQNGGCTSNCNSQTNTGCTNCNGNGSSPTVVTVISGTATTLYQCQSSSNTQTFTGPATNNDVCFLAGYQILIFTFVAGASGLSATGSVQSQSNIDVKFTDVTASQTLNSLTGTTSPGFNQKLTSGHTYSVQFTNDGGQNNVLTLSLSISG